jgi:hypothetical protein
MPGYTQCLITAQVDGTAYANSTTANTPLQPAAATYVFPSNFFYIGCKIRAVASGRISATVSGPTLNLGFALGTVATPIIVFAGGANALVARATTNVTWELVIDLTCRAIGTGTSANFMGTGRFISEAVLGSVANAGTVMSLPLSAPVVGTGFDSTLTQSAQVVATWGTASASNSIQLHQYELDVLNYTP